MNASQLTPFSEDFGSDQPRSWTERFKFGRTGEIDLAVRTARVAAAIGRTADDDRGLINADRAFEPTAQAGHVAIMNEVVPSNDQMRQITGISPAEEASIEAAASDTTTDVAGTNDMLTNARNAAATFSIPSQRLINDFEETNRQ